MANKINSLDEKFKKEFDCIFDNSELNVTEFKSKLKVKDVEL